MLEKLRARRESGEGGFTLIELLLVIVILGILAAVVVFSVRGITDRGSASTCKATLAATKTGSEAFYAKTGAYPAGYDDLDGTAVAANKFLDTTQLTKSGVGNITVAPPGAAPAWTATIGAAGAVTSTGTC